MSYGLLIHFGIFKDYHTPHFNEVEEGEYWFHLVCPSVCLSVCLWTEWCPLCIFHNTSWIHFIFTHLINQVCRVLRFLKNSKIRIFGNFFNIFTLTLSCVHVIWMLKLIPELSFCISDFWFSMMIPLDGLLDIITSWFGQNCKFLFFTFFYCAFHLVFVFFFVAVTMIGLKFDMLMYTDHL